MMWHKKGRDVSYDAFRKTKTGLEAQRLGGKDKR